MAFDRAFEVPRAVALVRAFLQEEVAAGIGHAEQELTLGGFQNALLHLAQLDFQHPLKLPRASADETPQSCRAYS